MALLSSLKNKVSDLLGAPAYPGEDPQTESDNDQLRGDYSMGINNRPPDEYSFAMSPTHVSVGDDTAELFSALQIQPTSGPHAYGKLTLHYRWDAVWEIHRSTMSLHLVEKKLRRYTKDQGWNWAGIIDDTGSPLEYQTIKNSSVPGIGEINPGVLDYMNKEWSGTDQFDTSGFEQVPFYGLQDPEEDFPMSAPRTCSECGQLMLNYEDWRKHVIREHVNRDRKPPADPQPVVDLDDVLPAGFNEAIMDKTVQRQSRLIFQLAAAPKIPYLPGPIPFVYDIETDRVFVGHPGEKHSDIKGRFTPGGYIEGLYDPKGNVQIKTDTDMPYTVRHMAELWYAMHPELVIKSIFLMSGDKKFKLASSGIGNTVRNIAATDPAAWAAYKALEPLGAVYAVGGCVRDVVLGKTPKDIDLMVQGVEPDEVESALQSLPGRVDFTGKDFGVFRYRDRDGYDVEIALPRTERSTGPGHKDFEVVTNPYISVGEDLARRDFTGNAMAVNLSTGQLIDPYHGSEDLKNGVLRAVSDRSFIEDPLRILRALSQISRHGLDPDPETYHMMAATASSLDELPKERIQAELDKLMMGDDPAKAIDIAEATGVLPHILPEVAATVGFDQKNKFHNLFLNEHLKEVLRRVAERSKDVDLRWAGLLHDIGKPGSQWFDDEGVGHFYKNDQGEGEDHELLGADMAKNRLQELKFPNDRINRITHLITHHMWPKFENTKGARKFLNRVGDEHAENLLDLRWADAGGKGRDGTADDDYQRYKALIDEVRAAGEPTDKSMLAVNGHDLIEAGIPPGKDMGRIFEYLTNVVLEDPSLNNRDSLLELALQAASEVKTSNILDPVQDSLDPAIYDHTHKAQPTVKDDVRSWIIDKVYNTLTNAGWPDPSKYVSLYLTGSLTTYQWSDTSDCDISLWINNALVPEWVRADLIALFIEKCDGILVPGTQHPLQVFVVNSQKFEPYNLYRPGLRAAYDLRANRWFVAPERRRAIDTYAAYPDSIAYAKQVVEKIKMMLRYDKYALKEYWHQIHHKRQQDMNAGKGDFSESNIAYKMIAHEGLLPLISEQIGEYIA